MSVSRSYGKCRVRCRRTLKKFVSHIFKDAIVSSNYGKCRSEAPAYVEDVRLLSAGKLRENLMEKHKSSYKEGISMEHKEIVIWRYKFTHTLVECLYQTDFFTLT